MRIVLTGGIACGKSTFAKFLAEFGIRFLDADDVVHELEGVGGAAVAALVERFGEGIKAADGSINRRALAANVFADSAARHDLESILFPEVRKRLLDFIGRGRCPQRPVGLWPVENNRPCPLPMANDQQPLTNGGIRLVIIPLLFESHWESDYDIIICIASPRETQIERMMRMRGYTREQAEARLKAQLPVTEKMARADYTVMNDSTAEHLKDEAIRLVCWLKEKIKDERRS